jgi:hypothetical protein
MKKKMITIITVIFCALGIFLAFGFYKSADLKNIQIVKKVVVKGSPQEVFDMVRYLGNFPKWSPFLAQDPTQKYSIKGTDGAPGAQYHWDGNGGKDLGYQEIVKVDSLNYVGMKCDIQKPFEAKPTFEYYFKETANGIEVTQDFKVESPAVAALFMWLGGAKAEMEKTNETGLGLLKKAVEAN